MISKGDKAVCMLRFGTVICGIYSVKRHIETNLFVKKVMQNIRSTLHVLFEIEMKSTFMCKFVSKDCRTSAASISAANVIARHGKSFGDV